MDYGFGGVFVDKMEEEDGFIFEVIVFLLEEVLVLYVKVLFFFVKFMDIVSLWWICKSRLDNSNSIYLVVCDLVNS